ncbi:MAG: leucine-rich repeat protein [Lachnospiraceae bacterium]|nr:leucine-rich repeat protein [Lachnospiraceae bacterium]
MKRRMISMLLAFVMVLSMLVRVTPTVHATGTEGTKTFENVSCINRYCYYDEEGNVTAKMLLMDGETVLTEGEDYTIGVTYNEEQEKYEVVATGMGIYQGNSDTYLHYMVYHQYETDEWTYIVDEDGWVYLASYTGNEASVTVPKWIEEGENKRYIDDVISGVFVELEHVTDIDVGDNGLADNIIINCENLAQLTISRDSEIDVSNLIIGNVAEGFNITAPSTLTLWDAESDVEDATINIKDYCDNKGYEYTDKSVYTTINGFNYSINGERAEILSYTGTATEVTVPNSIDYDDEEVYVEYVHMNAFTDLSDLTSISLGDVYFGLPLCKNCPSLESITTKNTNVSWSEAITDNPSEDVTIYAYSDAIWCYHDEDYTEQEGTISDYCEQYGYSYGELEKQYTVLDMVMSIEHEYDFMSSEYNSMRLIGGTTATASLGADTEEQGYVRIDSQDVTWESENTDVLTIDSNGLIVVSNVDKSTTVELVATTTFGGEEQEKRVSVYVFPRLETGMGQCFVTDSPITMIPCQYRDYVLHEEEYDGETYDYYAMELVDMPESFVASYESNDTSVAVVNEDGTIQAAEGAEVGSTTTITVTYTDGTNTYITIVDVEVGEISEVPFELPSTDGEAINVYSWNEEAASRIEYFLQMYPQYEGLINFYTIPNENNAYWEGVLAAFEEEGKEPDIILSEAGYITESLLENHIVDLSQIGFEEEWYANAYPYTKAIGSQNDELKAVAWQSCPGCFMYRTDIAEEVFGTSDSDEVQKLVADWDSFMEVAKTLQEAGYDIVSGVDDLYFPAVGNTSTPLVSNNVVNLDGDVENYLNITKQVVDNDYTACTTKWSDEWQANADGNVFGYFGCEWFLNFSFFPEEHKDDYRICEGPGNYFWGGSWMSVTNTGHNDDLIKLLLYTLTCDENAMYRIARGTGDFVNNKNVCQRMSDEGLTTTDKLNNQNPYPIWIEMAENIPAVEPTVYDFGIKSITSEAADKMCGDEKELETVAEAIEYIKTEIQKKYPDLTFEAAGHSHTFSTEWTIDKAATCIEAGSKSHHCTYMGCTEKMDVTVIPVTGQHSYDAGVIQTLPTCVDKGSRTYTCTACKQTKTDEIAATGQHSYDTGVIQTLPTCVDKGSRIYTCTVCKQTKTEEIAATGTHVFGDWVETKEPTVDKKGEKTRTCTTCTHQEKEEIAKTGHVKDASFSKGSAKYTIDTVKGKKGTVTYEATTKKSKKVSVPKTVKIDGKTYTVTEIADDAFKGNNKMTSVTIPEGVTKIGKNAFSGCKNLKTITIKSTKLKSVGSNAIKGINKKATIKVPSKQLSKYKKLFKSRTGFKKTMKIKK